MHPCAVSTSSVPHGRPSVLSCLGRAGSGGSLAGRQVRWQTRHTEAATISQAVDRHYWYGRSTERPSAPTTTSFRLLRCLQRPPAEASLQAESPRNSLSRRLRTVRPLNTGETEDSVLHSRHDFPQPTSAGCAGGPSGHRSRQIPPAWRWKAGAAVRQRGSGQPR